MPRAFDITPSTTTAKVEQGGSAEFSFTVSNKLGKAVRARFTPEPDPKMKDRASWLKVTESELDLAHDATLTCTVRVAVPPDAALGAFSFHLAVSSTSNPDEDYAHGPPVSVDVTKKDDDKPFPWWIVAVAAGLVVLVAGGFGIKAWLERTPKPGAPCPATGECPANQVCVALESGVKTCLLAAAQPCESPIECASSFCRLDNKTCSRTDQGCDIDGECPAPFACHAKRCVLPDGAQCQVDTDCKSSECDTTKTPSVCVKPVAVVDCIPPCAAGFQCSRGQCRPRIFIKRYDLKIAPGVKLKFP